MDPWSDQNLFQDVMLLCRHVFDEKGRPVLVLVKDSMLAVSLHKVMSKGVVNRGQGQEIPILVPAFRGYGKGAGGYRMNTTIPLDLDPQSKNV